MLETCAYFVVEILVLLKILNYNVGIPQVYQFCKCSYVWDTLVCTNMLQEVQ
uniref:Uncharacterized protein n=1 Tax=Rhizophora mucronata TaxID=61149 RepID=A0A2P2PMP1_RHIMU